MKLRRYSLSIHIVSLFLIMTSLIGVTLIWISYQHAQALLDETAKQLSYENSRKIETEYKQNIGPVLTALDSLAYSTLVEETDSPLDNLRWLASIALVFKKNENLVALYFGDEAGNFTMIRPLSTKQDRQQFSAPESAILYLNKTQTDGTNEVFFLDEIFHLIGYEKTDNNRFDPRKRPWYTLAKDDGEIRLTEPYFFYFLKTHGITLSRKSASGQKVIGADFTLDSLSNQIKHIGFSDKTKLILFDQQYNILAQHNTRLSIHDSKQKNMNMLKNSLFAPIVNRMSSQTIYETRTHAYTDWSITLTPVILNPHATLMLAEATPQDDLLAPLLSLRDKQITIAIVLFFIGFIIAMTVAAKLSSPLKKLVALTNNITQFQFKKTRYPTSIIKEVANLTYSVQLMEHTLHDLLKLLKDTASNHDFNALAKTITHQSYLVTRAETVMLYLLSPEDKHFVPIANHSIIPFKININDFLKSTPWIKSQLQRGEIVHINRSDNEIKHTLSQLHNSDIYLFPLMNREDQLVGILNLGYERKPPQEHSDKHAFLRELLSFAQIAKENIDKIQQQKKMFDSFVELIASAIDSKSPYTQGHCQRVPLLTKWITEAADKDDDYYPLFKMDENQWEALHFAAWLHDCGKITTPEHIVDKSTKLETIYNRIHEIRMRFELLKLQAERDFWQNMAAGGDQTQLQATLDATQQTLDEEFAFVAYCNTGKESISEADVKKLHQIAQRTWTRTLDDQLGLSWVEQQRAGSPNLAPLPVTERLLDDKPSHQITRNNQIIQNKSNETQVNKQTPFTLKPGSFYYNLGELHNLSVPLGTLTNEERFILNDHITQTISMLEKLPYAEHMKNVPEIAGGHHERMDGCGYPRAIHGKELSIQARVIAIADVFEALTSSGRPYKQPRSLSESIQLMTEMATTGHLDPKLYLLFLEHGIYLRYAQQFLDETQDTSFDKTVHIKQVRAYLKTIE